MIKQMQTRDCIDEGLLESFRNARSQGELFKHSFVARISRIIAFVSWMMDYTCKQERIT